MKIIISGWPAVGGSTLAMSMSILLKYKYMYAGGLMRFLANKMYPASEGSESLVEFDQKYGTAWDNLWEGYISQKLKTDHDLILEAKTAGFLYDGDDLFKVMLIADQNTRISRARSDSRPHPEELISQRDQILKSRWDRNFNINIFDKREFSHIYHNIIDVSDMTLSEEVEIFVDAMRRSMRFEGIDFAQLLIDLEDLAIRYKEGGKLALSKSLKEQGLQITPQQILKEINSDYSQLVGNSPQPLQEIILQYK